MSDTNNFKRKYRNMQNPNAQEFEQEISNCNKLQNKKIKLQNSNTLTFQQILDAIKQINSNIDNIEDNEKEKLKEENFQEIKNTLQLTQQKLDSIQNQLKRNEVYSLLQKGSLSEQQFIEIFNNNLNRKVLREDTDHDGGAETESYEYEYEYTSPLLPINSCLKYECSIYLEGYYDQQGFCPDIETSTKTLKYVSKDQETSLTLLYYKTDSNELSEEIKLPTYNKNFIHIQNLNIFIQEILGIYTKNHQNLNKDILFEKLTHLFYSLSEDQEYFINKIQ